MIHQHQNENHYQNQSNEATRRIAPVLVIAPARKGSHQYEYQNDQNN